MIRETVTPVFEPITIEVPRVVSEVAGGVGDVVAGGIVGLADITVMPIADMAQAGLKALHTAVTGQAQDLTPLSTFGNSVVNGNAGTWEGLKVTGKNVFDVSPVGMVYHAGTGGYGLTTAVMNGDVRAATWEGVGLGLNFAGAKAAGLDRYGIEFGDIGAVGPGRNQRGAINLRLYDAETRNKILANFRAGNTFEAQARQAAAAQKNYDRIYGTGELEGSYAVPDARRAGRIVEIKDWRDLARDRQFQIYEQSGSPIDLITSPKTQSISGPLIDTIKESGGTVSIFEPRTGAFHRYDFGSGTYLIE